MGQSLNLSVSGLYTSISDFNGLPPGALNEAINVESRYKNVIEPRRGFEGLVNSSMTGVTLIRLINFVVDGVDRTVGLTDDGRIVYYTGTNPWPVVIGSYSSGIQAPDAVLAKSRFIRAGQNLYVTSKDGVRSLSSGAGAQSLKAGVPKALNLEAQTNSDLSGFFSNNTVTTTTGNISSGGANITNISDTTGIIEGMYVGDTLGHIPTGTTVSSITPQATILIQTGTTTANSTTVSALAISTGIVAGVKVSGTGIQTGTVVNSISGGGPYSVVLSLPALQSATGVNLTFSSALIVTMSANATATVATTALTFYSGSQVGYRIVYGRIETDSDGNTITRLGSPSAIGVALNTSPNSTNVVVTTTLPKASENSISFYQLYRSEQTAGIDITPLDQYNLVKEENISSADFTARVLTLTDTTPDSLKGIPLYAGSDREGILQANDPPPLAWDACPFRDFMLYANITQPTTVKFTMVSVGAPTGLQVNDTITVNGTVLGVAYSKSYTGKATENAAAREFKVFTSGTPSQNISDTANSFIRVVNYDEDLPVHAILISSTTDLPGQILLEADSPGYETFFVTASAHTTAYDPTLSALESESNNTNNGLIVSKSGELEATPATNLLRVGDSSAPILRIIPLRDYVVILKSDGIYRLQGFTPSGLVVNPFDLTTKIIGPDTAVSLNSGVWMLSNQGVVSVSDGGVEAKSIPVDDQLNRLTGRFLTPVTTEAFAVGYESDRKYVLSLPQADEALTTIQYVFNYVTNSWTKWDRRLRAAYIHSNDGKIYISRGDSDENGVSKERKSGTYQDFVDEAITRTIISVPSPKVIELNISELLGVGDVVYQDANNFSPILAVDTTTNLVTVQDALNWAPGPIEIRRAFECTIQWKQVFGDNPAFVRQFSEGLALFKNTRFNLATLDFATDYSGSSDRVTVYGTGNGLYGLFPWGGVPWGGPILPDNIRFLIPQSKQLGSYLIPSMQIKQGLSDFKFQGLSITYFNASSEVGL